MKVKKFVLAVGLVSTPLYLAACLGSSDDVSPAAPSTGIFGDSAVQGIHYKTATQEGDTDANGTFKYLPGETVIFSLGGTTLGTAASGANLTPADLKDTTGAALTGNKLTYMLQALQSLDSDGNPGNGITIPPGTATFKANCTPNDSSACTVVLPATALNNFNAYIASVPALASNAALAQAVSSATALGTQLFTESIPQYASWAGVPIVGSGYGSAFTPEPNKPGYFYGMTDRGPNITAPDGTNKIEPFLNFQPAIAEFQLVNGKATVVKTIGFALADGTPMNGRVNPEADTAEIIYDVNGNVLPHDAGGLDPEGLVALADGTFWVSDEYGPYILHFDATGKEIERFDPYATSETTNLSVGGKIYPKVHPLPGELKKRKPNKGMEGLTLTTDGKYLVGAMQSPLDQNGTTKTKAGNGAITRIVKVAIADATDVHEYLYSLHTNGAKNPEGQAISEITALPDGTFIVDERDGNFEGTSDGTANGTPKADKNLWKIDLSKATDVGPRSALIGTTIAGGAVTYDAATGLLVAGKTIEDIAGTSDAPDAVKALSNAGIATGAESLFLNYAGLFTSIDPKGMYFGHDKVEGVAVDPANPNVIYISNDSDFGITDEPATVPMATAANPFPPSEKFLPDGKTQDFGEVIRIDLTQVPAKFKQ